MKEEKDALVWSWNTKLGQVSAKQAYKALQVEERGVEIKFRYTKLWNWKLPLKIQLFIWLLLEQKILTWEIMKKRGFNGPSKCVLCGIFEETICHLFIDCNFIKSIWTSVTKDLNNHSEWGGGEMEECFKNCILKKDNKEEIPCIICWEVWKHRNLIIFENAFPSMSRVFSCILQDLGEYKPT